MWSPIAKRAPTCPSTGARPVTYASIDVAWSVKICSIAEVEELECIRADLSGDVRPDGGLVGRALAGIGHRPGDLGHPLRAAGRILGPRRRREPAGLRAPAPGLDARHRDDQLGLRGHEDGQVDDPVLLRADELLAIDDERRLETAIDHSQLRHHAVRGHFCNFGQALADGIVQGHVVDRLHRAPQEREHHEVLERDLGRRQ